MNEIHKTLDAAILKPNMSSEEVRKALGTCIEHRAFSACVRPCDIPLAVEMCTGTETKVSCVLSFPHGNALPSIKAQEAKTYIDLGVHEIDMVVNIGAITGEDWNALKEDIEAVTKVAKGTGVLVKTIFETCYLSVDQIKRATAVAIEAGADFVKTSTGFADGPATEESVQAMLDAAQGKIKVKPSGGIRDTEKAQMYLKMGADRLGIGYTSLESICAGVSMASNEAY